MNSKQVAKATAKVLQNYLTYQAVLTIIQQLSETNPSRSIWLQQYASGNRIQDGEAFIQGLMQEHKELVLRILTVRSHLAETVLDFVPEMVNAGIQQSNTEYRRQVLERLTQTADPTSTPTADIPEPDTDRDERN
jgi:hypothetical protein